MPLRWLLILLFSPSISSWPLKECNKIGPKLMFLLTFYFSLLAFLSLGPMGLDEWEF